MHRNGIACDVVNSDLEGCEKGRSRNLYLRLSNWIYYEFFKACCFFASWLTYLPTKAALWQLIPYWFYSFSVLGFQVTNDPIERPIRYKGDNSEDPRWPSLKVWVISISFMLAGKYITTPENSERHPKWLGGIFDKSVHNTEVVRIQRILARDQLVLGEECYCW